MSHLQTARDNPVAVVQIDAAAALSRRDALKVGIGFTAAVSCLGLLPGMTGCSRGDQRALTGFQYLKAEDVALFSALVTTVVSEVAALNGPQRKERIESVLRNIDAACAALGWPAQQELRKLLDLLAIGPLRWALTGVAGWKEAGDQAMQNFLSRWRSSRFATLNAGANALIKLTSAGYYMMPVAWPAVGYPGPLEYVYQAVNT